MEIEKYLETIKNKRFDYFRELLEEKNKIFNLTAISDEKGILYKHFLDSAAGECFFPVGAEAVEIGSGGGFPSIPIKLLREDLKFTLIESTGKKCAFLREAVDNLSLNCVKVLNIRAEEGAHDKNLREKFDVACARAVAQLNTLSEYCLPYVKVGGLFIAYKGECCEELKAAKRAVKILGGEVERVVNYELPEGCGKRSLVLIRKLTPTPAEYPRGRGRERKNPL